MALEDRWRNPGRDLDPVLCDVVTAAMTKNGLGD